jgi:hypothetical protein
MAQSGAPIQRSVRCKVEMPTGRSILRPSYDGLFAILCWKIGELLSPFVHT